MCLQSFVFELHHAKKISTWEIKWIFDVVLIWTSNAHKNLIWLSGTNSLLIKVEKILIRNIVLNFQILDLIRTIFMNF